MSDIYDDLDAEVSASEVIKYWKDMYRKMASLNDELYTRIEALKAKVTSLQLIEKHLLQCCKDHKSRIEELEAELIEAKCCLVKRERYHKAKLKQVEETEKDDE